MNNLDSLIILKCLTLYIILVLSRNPQGHSTSATTAEVLTRWRRDPPSPRTSGQSLPSCDPRVCNPGWRPGCPRPSHLEVYLLTLEFIAMSESFQQKWKPDCRVWFASPQILQRFRQPGPGPTLSFPWTYVNWYVSFKILLNFCVGLCPWARCH